MKIYLDMFFFVNFLMNYVVLYVVSLIKRKRISLKRTILVSAVASCLSVVYLLTGIGHGLICSILVCFVQTLIGFGKQKYIVYIKDLIIFFGTYWVLGGGLQYLSSQVLSGEYTLILLLVCAIVILMTGDRIINSGLRYKKHKSCIHSVTLEMNGKKTGYTGYVDTGNQLIEPISGEPVMIIQKNDCNLLEDENLIFRMIPYHSIGKKNGMLQGIRIDRAIISNEGKESFVWENPWVAISQEEVSATGEYQVLLQEVHLESRG